MRFLGMENNLGGLLWARSWLGREHKNDEKTILVVSAIVGISLFWFVPVTYYSSSDSYLRYARWLLWATPDISPVYFRTPGYPAWLIITGVTQFDSFTGLLLSQLAMAVWIPILIYKIVLIYDKRTAYWTSLASIISLIPFGFMKAVLTEELYIFTLMLTIYFASQFFHTKKNRYIYIASMTFFFLLLIRPVAGYMFAILLFAVVIFAGQSYKRSIAHAFLSLMLVLLLIQGWTIWRNAMVRDSRMQATALNMTSMVGKLLFYNVYLGGGHNNNDVLVNGGSLDNDASFIQDDTGPASRELITVLKSALTDSRIASIKADLVTTQFEDEYFYKKYEKDPERLAEEIVRAPSLTYYFFVWKLLDGALGPSKADNLLLKVSVEILRKQPGIGLRFVMRNIYFFVTGISIDYIHALHPNYNLKVNQPNLSGLTAYTPFNPDGVLTARLADALKHRPGGEWTSNVRSFLFYYLWSSVYLIVRPVLFILMLCGGVVLLKTQYAPIALLCMAIVLYQMLIVCIFVMPIDRYVAQTVLVELLVAAPALSSYLKMIPRLSQAGVRSGLAAPR